MHFLAPFSFPEKVVDIKIRALLLFKPQEEKISHQIPDSSRTLGLLSSNNSCFEELARTFSLRGILPAKEMVSQLDLVWLK